MTPVLVSCILLFVFIGLPCILLFREHLLKNHYTGIWDWMCGPYLGPNASYGNYYVNTNNKFPAAAPKPATSWVNSPVVRAVNPKTDIDGLLPGERKIPPQPCFFSKEEVSEGPPEERYMSSVELRVWQNKKAKDPSITIGKDTKIPEDSDRGLFLEQNVKRPLIGV